MLLTSRAPQEMPPTWNVVLLMTPLSWLCTLVTMMAVVVFLDITSLMVKRGMGLSVTTREIVLYPFRYIVLRLIHSLRRFLSVQSEVSLSKGRISEGQKAGQSVRHDHSELLQPPVPDLGSLRGLHHAHALQVDIYNNL